MKFKITLEKLQQLQEKLSIIDKNIEVNTPDGFKPIRAIGITSPNSEKIEIKTKDFQILGSPLHRVKYLNDWIHLKDIKIRDKVNTINGIQEIIEISNDSNKEDLWDIEVEGSEYYSNGILSHNSSLIESVEFLLYGKVKSNKAKKWAKLSSLPNRINGELLNKMKLVSGGTELEIKRGISPNILELSENGIVDDRAGKSNIDDKIERYVDMDIESFKSFISMSINDFKNFISLSNEEKQLLLDKLFNLEVINILNTILKELNKNNKMRLVSLDSEISTLEESINSIKRSIEKSKAKAFENKTNEIESIKASMESQKGDYLSIKEKLEKIKGKEEEVNDLIDQDKRGYQSTLHEIKTIQKELDLYDQGNCPTCQTPFNSDHFITLRSTLEDKKKSIESIKLEQEETLRGLKEKKIKLDSVKEEAQKTFNDITWNLKTQKEQLNKLVQQMESFNSTPTEETEEFEKTLNDLETKKEVSQENQTLHKEKELYYKEINKILGEDGVKKEIITGLIKPINRFIAYNVKKMQLPFDVSIDETFTATIKHLGSPVDHDSLSTGEMKKINICFLVAYLKLIKTKKHINILFLDEVFASIDLEGIGDILNLLRDFALEYKVSIFVVHHAMLEQEKFDRIIKIEKDIFSTIVEVPLD
jgi:DNA repair exonuclease SbcCD ATPase subunit